MLLCLFPEASRMSAFPFAPFFTPRDVASMVQTCRGLQPDTALLQLWRAGSGSVWDLSERYGVLSGDKLAFAEAFLHARFFSDFCGGWNDWTLFGEMHADDERTIAHVDGTSCFQLLLHRYYPDTQLHFGRGVVHRLSEGSQPTLFQCRMRFDLLDTMRESTMNGQSAVGYMILSDGNVGGRESLGRFGTEAVFLHFGRFGVRDDIHLLLAGREPGIQIQPNTWLKIAIHFDWQNSSCVLTCSDIAQNWKFETPFRFRSACKELGQISLLSLGDCGALRISWSDVLIF